MKPTRYDVAITQSLTADAHRTGDALREAMARVFPDVPWSPDLDDIGWGGELPDGRLVTRYHLLPPQGRRAGHRRRDGHACDA